MDKISHQQLNQFVLIVPYLWLLWEVAIWCNPEIAIEIKESIGCVPEEEFEAFSRLHRSLVKSAFVAKILLLLALMIQHQTIFPTNISSHPGTNPPPLASCAP